MALTLVHALPARAAEGRVAVLPLQGPGAEQLEKILVQVFPGELGLMPLAQVDRALAQAGAVLPVTGAQHAALARKLKATAIVGGRVSNGMGWKLRLTARDGATGAALASQDFDGKTRYHLAIAVRRQAPTVLRTLLAQAPAEMPAASDPLGPQAATTVEPAPKPRLKPKPEPETSDDGPTRASDDAKPAEEETPPPSRAPDASLASGRRGRPTPEPFLELSVGPRVMSRAFIYTDNVAGLPGYTLPAALGAFAEAELYPAARSASAVRNFGLAGVYEASLGAKTVGRDGSGNNLTRGKSYRAGIRYRIKFDTSAVTLGGDYGEHSFDLQVDDVIAPNVIYELFRPSVAARMSLGMMSLGVTAAYLHVLSIGDLGASDRFPRMTAKGAEVNVMAGLALDRDFELRLVADLRHYAHHMNVKPGDPLIVGGAVDEHFGASLLISYRLR